MPLCHGSVVRNGGTASARVAAVVRASQSVREGHCCTEHGCYCWGNGGENAVHRGEFRGSCHIRQARNNKPQWVQHHTQDGSSSEILCFLAMQ